MLRACQVLPENSSTGKQFSFFRKWKKRGRSFLRRLEEFYALPYRRALLREKEDEEYIVQLFLFMELAGIENPVTYYTWELQALMLEDFHQWHKRAGFDKSPFSHVSCC